MKRQQVLAGLLQAAALFSDLVVAGPIGCDESTSWTVGQMVETTSGKVQGRAASVATEVSEYLGIPYAMPPTDKLRFQPPVAVNTSSATINATQFGPSCMQGDGSGHQSEDCLSINIWTKPQVGERKKAILVWVYGGAYTSGSSSMPTYDGQYFANETDVVLISLNYRVNIFGFPGNPTTTPNLGLLDMRLAMEWIRDNADKFGGDTSRITIFGQSAGAGMTDFYSYAYASDPIANGFILMSATVNGFPALRNETTFPRWFRISGSVGCSNNPADADAITECMRNHTAQEILAAFGPEEFAVGAVPAFGPTADDMVVFANYSSRHAAKGGYLIGNTENEAGLFRTFQNRSDAYWEDFNFRYYTCPDAVRIAQAVADGNPTWRYRYFGDFPNLAVSVDPPSGAYHAADLPPLFGTVPQNPLPSTPEQVAIGDYLRGAWAAFAKDTSRGLLNYADGWPLYVPTEKTLIRTAFQNQTGANLALGNAYDGICQTLPVIPPP